MNRTHLLARAKHVAQLQPRVLSCFPLPLFQIPHLSISCPPERRSLMQITNNGRKLSGRDNPEQSILGPQEHRLHNTHLVSTSTGSPPHWDIHNLQPSNRDSMSYSLFLSHTLETCWLYGGGHSIVSALKKRGRNHWPTAKLAIFSCGGSIRLSSWSMLSLLARGKRSLQRTIVLRLIKDVRVRWMQRTLSKDT